jgi:hypothetical protein
MWGITHVLSRVAATIVVGAYPESPSPSREIDCDSRPTRSKETKMAMTHADSNYDTRTDRKQARSWAQIARLAGEAINSLVAGKVKDAQTMLTAIRGVALNADVGEGAAATNALPGARVALQPVVVPR